MLLAPLAGGFLAQPAAAATTAAQPAVTNMSLNSDAGVSPGATLRVQVNATPKAQKATLTLGESGITVPLREQGAGTYTGTYVVRRSDRIDPTQLMTARVTVAGHTYSRGFNFPPAFQALAAGAGPAEAAAPAMRIERLAMHPMGRLEPGRELHFRMLGTPGGDAWLDIPGVIRGVDLAETRPGVYEGNYTVRRRDDLDAFGNAVATLRNGNQRVTAKLDIRDDDRDADRMANRDRDGDRMAARGRDERSPQITDLMPANGERVGDRGRVQVGAHLGDDASGIDPASVRLRLNGRDVSADTRVSPDEAQFRGDLDPGRYTAELSVRDRAGNSTTKTWTFDVTPGDRVGNAGPLPLTVTSHRNNAVVDANGNLAIQGHTAPFANVRVEVESVANVAGVLGLTQPMADQTVQADRNGNFGVLVAPRGLPLPGTRYDVRLTSTSGNQTAQERLTLIQRQG
jgi:hypothetical protein